MAGETPDQGEGRVISGRYRLLRTLGAGGMGRVWLAYDEELACEVSMKEVALPDVPMDASEPVQRIARARSEARHAARLRGHPHVATVHDVVVHEGLPWIVMEYVPDAIDLQAVVRQSGPLSPAGTARIGLAVLDALTAGHRIGILHRDVKPANILLAPDASGDPYARVLLTDYGIALQPESREPRLTATAGILGTPGYLAPERARGEPPTPAADLFSLGATLYAAVEGRGPFDRRGDYATLTALLGEEPTPPTRAGELSPVLHGLLVKDPVRRSSPEAVARGLERVVRGAAGAGFGPPPGWGATPLPEPAPGGIGPPPGRFGAAPGSPSASVPSDEVAGAPPGYVGGAPPGYVAGSPLGQSGASAQGPYGGQYADPAGGSTPGTPSTPHSPQTPGAPPTPNTPQTPGGPAGPGTGDTPGAGGPVTPGGPAAPASGTPPPYAPWSSAAPQGAYDLRNNPYAYGPDSPYAGTGEGSSPPPPHPSVGSRSVPGPYAGGPPGPPPPHAGRKKPVAAVIALVVAVVLVIAGGAWAVVSLTGGDGGKKDSGAKKAPSTSASTSAPEPTGPVYPYGEQAGLTDPLQAGDCVKAVWSGTPFKSVPNLGVVDCADDWPDGQVVAVDTASDYADARAHGTTRCAAQAEPVATALPDAGAYALVPTKAGFTAADGATACLVLGRHVPIGGEVARFRDKNMDLYAAQMAIGDCWTYVDKGGDSFDSLLTDCAKPHTDQVVGFAAAPKDMDYKKGIDNGGKLCSNKFESSWAPGSELKTYGWLGDKEDWNDGFTTVVCTVGHTDNTKTTGKIPTPGTV
ncbi:protein kinase domain-containing protein [Streptomyces sp. NBC_00996]|uniref:serine/threonine-protein kinase n=1 Tax=Streptomyces sp. NBC_00996 TaxID=2903710 RepID=UPI003864AFF6|nr:protein kinase [Streptomyces sp. NBC_00996]